MKLDRDFHETTQTLLRENEKKYSEKYLLKCISVTAIVWSGIVIFHVLFLKVFNFVSDDLVVVSFLVGLIPILIYTSGIRSLRENAETTLWKKIASDNQGSYSPGIQLDREESKMLTEGFSREGKHQIWITGEFPEKIRVFSYQFRKQISVLDKQKYHKTFSYLVVGFKFAGDFPHLYLNYKKNQYALSVGTPLSLPAEFEKDFTLSIPEGYHIEALEIFTPEILHTILELCITCDIELVKGEILFFIEQTTELLKDFQAIENKIGQTREIASMLKPRLQRFRFAPVGNLSSKL